MAWLNWQTQSSQFLIICRLLGKEKIFHDSLRGEDTFSSGTPHWGQALPSSCRFPIHFLPKVFQRFAERWGHLQLNTGRLRQKSADLLAEDFPSRWEVETPSAEFLVSWGKGHPTSCRRISRAAERWGHLQLKTGFRQRTPDLLPQVTNLIQLIRQS